MNSIHKVLSHIEEGKVTDLTRELVRIPSENPPGNEREVAEFIRGRMEDLGLEIHFYECSEGRPNVIGKLKGEGNKSLMFNAHTDTVPVGDREFWSEDPFGGAIKDGKLYGRGATDMKGGLAAMLIAIESLIESGVKLKGDVMLAAVIDEEHGKLGTKSIVERGYRADAAVIGEPTELKVCIAHKGALRLEIATIGKAAHSSDPLKGVNAIYKMAKICLAMELLMERLNERGHVLVGNASVSVGTITGGVKVNMVPDRCVISVDRRLIPGESVDNARMEIEEILKNLQSGDPEFKYTVKTLQEYNPSEISEEEEIVKSCRLAVEAVEGVDPGVSGFPAGCDMYLLVNEVNIPTVILGPGSLAQAHQPDEFVEVKQVVDAAKIYSLITLMFLGYE